jgi:hypothetical protein
VNLKGINYKNFPLYYIPKEYNIPYIVIYKDRDEWKDIIKKLKYPIIFKPNTCTSKGNNVEKIENVKKAEEYIKNYQHNEIMIQEFDDSPYEASVLYERYPIFEDGRIISVVKKVLHEKGKFVQNIATSHMVDMPEAITPKLNGVINEITKKIPGLHAGRYDIKFRSLDELKDGKFKVIELNGSMGVDHRAYVKSKRDLSFDNFHIQVGWITRRIIMGLINNSNPMVAYSNVVDIVDAIKLTRKCNPYLLHELFVVAKFLIVIYFIIVLVMYIHRSRKIN